MRATGRAGDILAHPAVIHLPERLGRAVWTIGHADPADLEGMAAEVEVVLSEAEAFLRRLELAVGEGR